MKVLPIAFALLAGTSLLPGATVSDRLDHLEAKVSGMEKLLKDIARTPNIRPSSPAHSSGHYQIRQGDSYWSIARRHKVSVSALERANPGVNPRTLSIGKTITIPGRSRTSNTNKSTRSSTYRVKPGDILGRISEAHGIRLSQLRDANPGLNPRLLKIGSILNIPGHPSRAAVHVAKPSPGKATAEKVHSKDDSTPRPPSNFRPNPYLTETEKTTPETRKLEQESPPSQLEEPRLITVNENLRLSEIAEQHNTTVAMINQLNKRDLSPKQMIMGGSQLFMPAR